MTERIGLVGCVKTKLPNAAPARDLYTSSLFRGRRAYVERTCHSWFILSAKHGLVAPGQVLEPYDVTLDHVSAKERRAWSRRIVAELQTRLGRLDGRTFEIHAGSSYLDFGLSEGLKSLGAKVVRPVEGLGLFQQQAFYAVGVRHQRANVFRSNAKSAAGKYTPLAIWLANQVGTSCELRVEELDDLVGGLPASARRHRAWWANNTSHTQARAWLEAGWRVKAVDTRRVIFVSRRDDQSLVPDG
ncbi:MAG: DUF6884 domain-containing protein [Actinomycetota bacterium]